MALLPPHYLDAVVAIGQKSPDGSRQWGASAFFYGVKDPAQDGYHAFLVTNRHVVQRLTQGSALLRCNPKSGPASEWDLNIQEKNGQSAWGFHPDSGVDVAVTGINMQVLQTAGMNIYFFESTKDVALGSDLTEIGTSEGDFAYVLGFPMGRVGGQRNAVIVRSGSIARIRETLLDPREPFTVDTFVFPGNSGGPVVLRPEALSIEGTKGLDRAVVAGVVRGYVPYRDVAYSKQTDLPRVVFEENSGLAEVHTMDMVNETIFGIAPSLRPGSAPSQPLGVAAEAKEPTPTKPSDEAAQ